MVTNQCGIPLFVQAHSGNKSDKKTLIETIQMFKSNLDFTEKSYFVADSAFFSSKNIGLLGNCTLWITRVPSTVGEVKDFQSRDLEMKTCSDDRYSIFETEINYGGIDLKFIVVDSREMHASKAKTFDRRIDKEFTQARKSLKKLGNVVFACEADARKAVDRWISENPHFILKSLNICVISKRIGSKRGRPKKTSHSKKAISLRLKLSEMKRLSLTKELDSAGLSWQAMIRPSMEN
jgi:transposase